MTQEETLVVQLGLQPHPEGGFFRETFRSPHPVVGQGGMLRSASTAIFFLLPRGIFSAWHRVHADEAWHLYAGGPLVLHLISAEGAYTQVTLGMDLVAGQRPQHVVPAGVWQAAQPTDGNWALAGCTVSPGFDFADFEMPTRDALIGRHPQLEAVVRRFTR